MRIVTWNIRSPSRSLKEMVLIWLVFGWICRNSCRCRQRLVIQLVMWPWSRTGAPLTGSSAHGRPPGTTHQPQDSAREKGEWIVSSIFRG